MKTLLYVKTENQQKAMEKWTHEQENLVLYCDTKGFTPAELQRAANFANQKHCDLIIDTGGDAPAEHVKSLLSSLSDKELVTEIIIASANGHSRPRFENTALLLLQVLTGEIICGFRSKFRLYPVKLLTDIPDNFFNEDFFYTRILIQGSRAGYKINGISLDNYAPGELSPVPPKSFFIAELFKALIPWPRKRLCERNFRKEKLLEFLFHPLKFLKFLLMENAYPGGLAAAAATGMFLGTLPLIGFHTAAIIYVSIKLRLNKVLSVNISHLCMPPFVPFACIEIGYYLRNGAWLTTADFQTVVKELHLRLLDWLLGSLVLAPLNAIIFALITYAAAITLQKALAKRQKFRVEKSQ